MPWLIIAVVVIAAFAIPRFGKVVLIGLGILVIVVCLYLVSLGLEEKRAKTRIGVSEVQLEDLTLTPSTDMSYVLTGRVRNRSARFTLTSVGVKFTMRDCSDSANCEVVGESDESISMIVPPGQTRAISGEYVFFSGLGAPRGRRQWDYQVTTISGK